MTREQTSAENADGSTSPRGKSLRYWCGRAAFRRSVAKPNQNFLLSEQCRLGAARRAPYVAERLVRARAESDNYEETEDVPHSVALICFACDTNMRKGRSHLHRSGGTVCSRSTLGGHPYTQTRFCSQYICESHPAGASHKPGPLHNLPCRSSTRSRPMIMSARGWCRAGTSPA